MLASTFAEPDCTRQVHVVAEGGHLIDGVNDISRKVAGMAGHKTHAPE